MVGHVNLAPDTILLDIDGTLIDSTYLHALAWTRAFHAMDERASWVRVHRAIGLGGDKLVGHVLGQRAEDRHGNELRSRWEEEYAALVPEVAVLPGASELIHELRQRGLRIALASSGAQRFTDDALSLLGITADDVDAVTSADDVDKSKPDPDILQIAMDRAGGTRGVLVGDTTWDVESAIRSGMPCVAVLSGGISAQELDGAGAVSVVPSVADLQDQDWASLPRHTA
jgi:HAD superfamily hydrolase (TIGR01549 family)